MYHDLIHVKGREAATDAGSLRWGLLTQACPAIDDGQASPFRARAAIADCRLERPARSFRSVSRLASVSGGRRAAVAGGKRTDRRDGSVADRFTADRRWMMGGPDITKSPQAFPRLCSWLPAHEALSSVLCRSRFSESPRTRSRPAPCIRPAVRGRTIEGLALRVVHSRG